MRPRLIAAAIATTFCGFAISVATACMEKSVWDGVYSQEQAGRGEALYKKQCASCHKDDLEGKGPATPLVGPDFRETWDGQALGDLFEKIQESMPADHPGRLSREENADILAFILRFNEFPAGDAELRSDSEWLNEIRFSAAKPK
jgi:S-disulfanyl-L-cysteine oxidoreductase SoxD